MRSGLPVLSVLAVIVGVWYLAVAPMNVRVALDQELADFDAPLVGVREVAFFPPMTGG